MIDQSDHRHGCDDGNINADEGPVNEGDIGHPAEEEEYAVDLCSPSLPSSPSSQQQEGLRPREGEARKGGDGGMFEVEPAGTLRGALRVWVGGAVRSPSQWHLELLYRWVTLRHGGVCTAGSDRHRSPVKMFPACLPARLDWGGGRADSRVTIWH